MADLFDRLLIFAKGQRFRLCSVWLEQAIKWRRSIEAELTGKEVAHKDAVVLAIGNRVESLRERHEVARDHLSALVEQLRSAVRLLVQ